MNASSSLRLFGLLTALGVGYQVYAFSTADEDDLRALSGRVRLAGQPLQSGVVRFISMDNGRPKAAGAYVSNGEYTVPIDGGLTAGTYQVQISGIGQEEQIRANQEFLRGLRENANLDEPLPRRYNFESRIQVEVDPEGGVVGFDFNLK